MQCVLKCELLHYDLYTITVVIVELRFSLTRDWVVNFKHNHNTHSRNDSQLADKSNDHHFDYYASFTCL